MICLHYVLTIFMFFCNFLHFYGNFPGEPGLACFIGAKDDGSGGDNWSYKTCKAPVKMSSPTNQHPVFTGRMPFQSSNQQR